MEFLEEAVYLGNLKIELSVRRKKNALFFCTARDEQNRKVWKTPVLNNGEVKIYNSQQEAIRDVNKETWGLLELLRNNKGLSPFS